MNLQYLHGKLSYTYRHKKTPVLLFLKVNEWWYTGCGQPHTSWKLKNSSQNFDEAGSSITIDNERIAR